MQDTKNSRRAFFIDAAKILTTVAVAPTVLNSVFSSVSFAEEKRRGKAPAAGGGPVMVDPADGVAKAVKYVEDATKSPESKGNKCATCGFYKKSAMKDGKEVGTCTLFAGKAVYSTAWCASWNKKQS